MTIDKLWEKHEANVEAYHGVRWMSIIGFAIALTEYAEAQRKACVENMIAQVEAIAVRDGYSDCQRSYIRSAYAEEIAAILAARVDSETHQKPCTTEREKS